MLRTLALAPFFLKGVAVTVASFILFVGSVYLLLAAIFGLRMGYLVLMVSFFGWMLLLSVLWVVGAPGTPPNLGPRGTEEHWAVFAAATTTIPTKYPETRSYPAGPWKAPDAETKPQVDTVVGAVQAYLAEQAAEQLAKQGQRACAGEAPATEKCFRVDPTAFMVEDVRFATAGDGTKLAASHAAYVLGGTQVTVFSYLDPGNVPIYSFAFLAVSLIGFVIHLPLLDRAERKRKEILTGGTAPAWYGPA